MVRVTALTRSPAPPGRRVRPLLGGGAERLDDEEVAGHAAPADGVGRVLDGDVVVDDHRPDPHPFGLGHLAAHVEGHAIAGVVVDDVQDPLGRVEELLVSST